MKFTKIISMLLVLFLFLTNITRAEDKVNYFEDHNSISNFDTNLNISISEFNTGKVVSKRNIDKKVSFKHLSTYYALYVLSENLKMKKITLDSTLPVKDKTVSVRDIIFNLTSEENNDTLGAVFNYFKIDLAFANNFLENLPLESTRLNSLTLDDRNTTTAREISYLVNLTLKNSSDILEVTKNPKLNDKDNSLKFLPETKFRILGVSYSNIGSVSVAYSGDTRFIVAVLGDISDKDKFFDNLSKTYTHLFANYSYKLALKAGTYDINAENVTINNDIYDLFYNNHSIKDVKYLLMNDKILLFQNYETISFNMGTVFNDFIPNTKTTPLIKAKNTFIGDSNFDKKKNSAKVTIVLERTQYFASIFLLIYSSIFSLAYIVKKIFRKE